MTTNLNNCKKNIFYVIEKIEGNYVPTVRRLSELGFIKGSKVKIIEFSALKKTLLVEIQGYILSLRASVAELIKVQNGS